MRVGIVGCGAIGSFLASNLDGAALLDRHPERALRLADETGGAAAPGLEELVDTSDLVVEAASPAAVEEVGDAALSAGRDLLVMSVSGLMDEGVREALLGLAEGSGAEIYTPSGAVCGLDGIRSASVARVDSMVLTTRKPPAALEGAPGVDEGSLSGLDGPVELFEGPADEAVSLFPRNVNVSAALSLAGIGPAETVVRIVADPSLSRNVHEVDAEGEFGRLSTRVENVPSPDNPKTSHLAALSALATIRGIEASLKVGT